jgi:acyl-CoA reductase-like NAD-dependent aldehyde dehydrogenase
MTAKEKKQSLLAIADELDALADELAAVRRRTQGDPPRERRTAPRRERRRSGLVPGGRAASRTPR